MSREGHRARAAPDAGSSRETAGESEELWLVGSRMLGAGAASTVKVRHLRGITGVLVACTDGELCSHRAVREQGAATWRTHRLFAGTHRRAAQLCDTLAPHHEGCLRRRMKSSERGFGLEHGVQSADEDINVQ